MKQTETHDCYKPIETPAMTHIEACPVCGSAGQLWRYSESPDSPTTTVVMCSNGDKLGPQQGIVNEGCYLYIPTENAHRATIREAVKYWNEYAKALIAKRVSNGLSHPLEFGKRGEQMFFSIGAQSFLLAYCPETDEEFKFMSDMLTKAISRIDSNQTACNKCVENKAVIEAAQKLVDAKGRYHTEQNYKALSDAFVALKGK